MDCFIRRFFLVSFCVIISTQLWAAPNKIVATVNQRLGQAEVRLIFPHPINMKQTFKGNEAWLTFSSTTDVSNIRKLPMQLPKWIEQVQSRAGNKLYIRAKKNTVFHFEKRGYTVFMSLLEKLEPGAKIYPKILIDQDSKRADVVLIWPKKLTPKHYKEKERVVINFNQPIKNPQLSKLGDKLRDWLWGAGAYYDSMDLSLAGSARMRVHVMEHQIRLQFFHKGSIELMEEKGQLYGLHPSVRLERLKGQALQEGDRELEAKNRFRNVVDRTKDNLEGLRWLGDNDNRLRRWRKAISVYDHLFSIDDQEAGVVTPKAQLLHDYGNFVRYTPEWFKVEGQEEQYRNKVDGRYITGMRSQAEVIYEERKIKGGISRDSSGAIKSFDGWRRRGTGIFSFDFRSMDKLQLSAHGSNNVVGGGAAYTFGWEKASTRIGATYHKPDWNYLVMMARGGSVDVIDIRHEQQFTNRFLTDRLSAEGTVSYNRYNLKDITKAATSIKYEGALNYNVLRGDPVHAYLGYAILGEHKFSSKGGIEPTGGGRFSWVDIFNLEAHLITARVRTLLTDYIVGEAYGGYSYERFARTKGPHYGLSLIYEPIQSMEIGLKASREILISRGAGSYINGIGGYAIVRF
jgi:hypothetical protein